MIDPYIKRSEQQVRYRQAQAIIIEVGAWLLVVWGIWTMMQAFMEWVDSPPPAAVTVKPEYTHQIRTIASVTVRASRNPTPGLYGCPQGNPRG